jgi:extradiol dioxygenase family protein
MRDVIFHLAFPVRDLEETKRFYVNGLGCVLGRESDRALTLGLAGHQLVAHRVDADLKTPDGIYPRHYGLIFFDKGDWKALLDRATGAGLKFYRDPSVRFEGTRIEHDTFFLEDPSHNLLEFKHYTFDSAIFGETDWKKVGEAGSTDSLR